MNLVRFTISTGRILCLVFIAAAFTSCGKVKFQTSGEWASDWTVNGHRSISRTKNGVTRKLETTTDVQFESGRITTFPKAALIKLEQSGGGEQRQAELRENAGKLELWIAENGSFRQGSPDDQTWLDGFLSDLTKR